MVNYQEVIRHLRTDSIQSTLRDLAQPGVYPDPAHLKALKAELKRRRVVPLVTMRARKPGRGSGKPVKLSRAHIRDLVLKGYLTRAEAAQWEKLVPRARSRSRDEDEEDDTEQAFRIRSAQRRKGLPSGKPRDRGGRFIPPPRALPPGVVRDVRGRFIPSSEILATEAERAEYAHLRSRKEEQRRQQRSREVELRKGRKEFAQASAAQLAAASREYWALPPRQREQREAEVARAAGPAGVRLVRQALERYAPLTPVERAEREALIGAALGPEAVERWRHARGEDEAMEARSGRRKKRAGRDDLLLAGLFTGGLAAGATRGLDKLTTFRPMGQTPTNALSVALLGGAVIALVAEKPRIARAAFAGAAGTIAGSFGRYLREASAQVGASTGRRMGR